MSDVTIYGPVQSSYVRTARLVCEEKGIDYNMEALELGTEQHAALHPFRKVPVMKHGDVVLFETQAIARYLDDSFGGGALTPESAADRGVAEQWISSINCYVYKALVPDYALQYIFPRGDDGKPDRGAIDQAVLTLQRHFALLDQAYERKTWVAGGSLSLADLFIAPVVATAGRFPEAEAALGNCSNLARFLGAIASRPSWAAVHDF